MKKIAIITFSYCNNNYGQLLQAYALQAFLDASGHDAFLIDYQPDRYLTLNRSQNILIAYIKNYIKRFLACINIRMHKEIVFPDRRHFGDFRSKYLKYTICTYLTYNELIKNPPFADIYMTGSDQVWNPRVGDVSPYMLGFVKKTHKVAYASSLGGVPFPEHDVSHIYTLLSQYKMIGVREDSGVESCKIIGLKNVEFTPDPTVLLQQSQWNAVASSESPYMTNKRKIFVYSCYLPKGKLLEAIPDSSDFETIIVDITNDDVSYSLLSICDWIAAIRDANYVITNSFHATLFSLYFNTSFLTFRYDDSMISPMNTRFNTIANLTNLTERFPRFSQIKEAFEILDTPIDWDVINEKLVQMREIGTVFLKKACE